MLITLGSIKNGFYESNLVRRSLQKKKGKKKEKEKKAIERGKGNELATPGDPLRMIIASRRLNFASPRPQPLRAGLP